MLVAGLEIETAAGISDADGQPQPTPDDGNGPQQTGGRTGALAKGKSKDQINELACAASPVIPEPPFPVAACVPEIAVHLSSAKTSENRLANTSSTDGLSGPRNTGTSPTRPTSVDGPGAPADNASDSAPIQPPTAFEALVRASNAENAGSDEAATDSLTGAAGSPVAPAIQRPPSAESVSTPAPASPEPVSSKESGSVPDRPTTIPSEPQPVTTPRESEAASLGGDQQQDLPDDPKQASQGAAAAGRAETPLVLSAPVPSVAEPVPSPAPKLQSAGDSAPASAPPEVPPNVGAASPARDISLQVPNPDGPRVEVQVTDRAGTVHIVVRTEDSGLTRDLRSNLPELTQKLNQQGMEGEAWSPAEMHSAAAGHENPGHSREQSEGWTGSGGSQHGAGGNPHGGRKQFQGESADEESDENFSNAFTGAASWQPVR